jgi:broad specificity phosphatase PhoE
VTRPAILALVRHGESVWIEEGRFQGRGDPPLSDMGLRQAAAVGARLAAPNAPPAVPLPNTAPLAIWHSPLRRAAQTAAAIHEAREADSPLRSLDLLTELGQGEWEGLTHAEVRERFPERLAAWRADPSNNHAPGGESLRDAAVRAAEAKSMVLGDPEPPSDSTTSPAPAEPVLGYERSYGTVGAPPWTLVVADGILRLLMLNLLALPVERFWSFPMALASVTVLDLSAEVVRLRAHNLDGHITALGRR